MGPGDNFSARIFRRAVPSVDNFASMIRSYRKLIGYKKQHLKDSLPLPFPFTALGDEMFRLCRRRTGTGAPTDSTTPILVSYTLPTDRFDNMRQEGQSQLQSTVRILSLSDAIMRFPHMTADKKSFHLVDQIMMGMKRMNAILQDRAVSLRPSRMAGSEAISRITPRDIVIVCMFPSTLLARYNESTDVLATNSSTQNHELASALTRHTTMYPVWIPIHRLHSANADTASSGLSDHVLNDFEEYLTRMIVAFNDACTINAPNHSE